MPYVFDLLHTPPYAGHDVFWLKINADLEQISCVLTRADPLEFHSMLWRIRLDDPEAERKLGAELREYMAEWMAQTRQLAVPLFLDPTPYRYRPGDVLRVHGRRGEWTVLEQWMGGAGCSHRLCTVEQPLQDGSGQLVRLTAWVDETSWLRGAARPAPDAQERRRRRHLVMRQLPDYATLLTEGESAHELLDAIQGRDGA